VTLYDTLYGTEPVMKPPFSLASQPWLDAPETQRLLQALEAGGAPARFVGGCVRNALLGMKVEGIHLATPPEPPAGQAVLQAAGLRSVPTGLAHGTVTAIVEGRAFEVTSLRRDVETDGRHAIVTFTQDWLEDAQRRDFTMNAIYAGADGTLFDPVGGIADLR